MKSTNINKIKIRMRIDMFVFVKFFTINNSKNSFIFELNIVKSYNIALLCIIL